MSYFETIINAFIFRLQSMEWFDVVDIVLVAITFYIFIRLVRRSRVALLVRGLLTLGLVLVLTFVLLPLPTFDLIIMVGLLAMVVVTPVILQPELRAFLEQIGRRVGFSSSLRKDAADRVIPPVVWAIDNLAKSKTGALIVLEGDTDLQDIMETGIPLNGRITPELLQTIFFDKTPLHDGAVVVRGDQVAAAGCILPLTDRSLQTINRRMGTRHRAAVGMSEASDALIIIVSEETGAISLAHQGKLNFDLDSTTIRQELANFYTQPDKLSTESPRKWHTFMQAFHWRFHWPGWRKIVREVIFILLAFALALFAATAVRAQADPLENVRVDNIPLQVLDMPPDSVLTNSLPASISVDAQTTLSRVDTLGPDSFQATVSLAGIDSEPQEVPVEVISLVPYVTDITAIPSQIMVSVAPVISRTVPVTVKLQDADQMSPAYEVAGDPQARPTEVTVTGPSTIVEGVAQVQAAVSVANSTASINSLQVLVALDQNGEKIEGVTINPDQVQVFVPIRRRIDARNVGVRAVTEGSPPDGYWLSNLRVTPATVTIQGNPNQIAELTSWVDTLPVDLTEITGESHIRVPLDLPNDVQAIDQDGVIISTVTVIVDVSARTSDLLIERPIEIINDRGEFEITVDPQFIELLLTGPLPTLNQIETEPGLVRVTIDATLLEPNSSVEVSPTVILPNDVRAQLVQSSILVTTGPILTPEP